MQKTSEVLFLRHLEEGRAEKKLYGRTTVANITNAMWMRSTLFIPGGGTQNQRQATTGRGQPAGIKSVDF